MSRVESAQLSAYLDNEITPEKAIEIENALASDARLQAEFEALKTSSLGWRAAAESIMFTPLLTLPHYRPNLLSTREVICALVVFLLLIIVPKITEVLVLAVVLHLFAMLVILPWIVNLIRQDAGESFSEP